MAKTPIIPPLPEEEHFEQELGAYNYIPNDEDDGKLIMDYLNNNKDIAGIPKIAVCKESNIEQCKIAIQGGVVDLMMEPIEKDIVRREYPE